MDNEENLPIFDDEVLERSKIRVAFEGSWDPIVHKSTP
jgi:hypothetical protein